MSYNKFIPLKEQILYFFGRSATNFISKNIDLKLTKEKNNIIKICLDKGFSIKKKHNYLLITFNLGNTQYITKVRNTNSSDLLVFKQIFLDEEYSRAVEIIKQNKIIINNVLDLGSNIGLSILYFSSIFPQSMIIGIEPDPSNYNVLIQNCKINKLKTNLFNFGIWFQNEDLMISRDFRDGKDWSLTTKAAAKSEPNKIQGITIDHIMKQVNISSIDLLKIDIEGAEKFIFLHYNKIDEILSKTKVIIIEIHVETGVEKFIIDKLTSHQFLLEKSGEYTVGYRA